MILVNLLPVERRYVALGLEHAELSEAQDFVRRLHRHSVPVVSHRFSLAAREVGGGSVAWRSVDAPRRGGST